jgi:predicted enzyme related to lactoylglutathione lyase
MAITGLHGLVYTSEPEQLRAMLRDVFGFTHVDAGDGWLIFAMPPAELGVHPTEGENFEAGHRHLLSFMCDDINTTIAELRAKGVTVTDGPKDEGYGITAMLELPGNCDVMIYEPRHPIAAGLGGRNLPTSRRVKTEGGRPKAAKKKAASPRPGRRAKTAARRR